MRTDTIGSLWDEFEQVELGLRKGKANAPPPPSSQLALPSSSSVCDTEGWLQATLGNSTLAYTCRARRDTSPFSVEGVEGGAAVGATSPTSFPAPSPPRGTAPDAC